MTEGVDTVDVAGTQVRVFSVAKTVADCFKYRNKIGLDVALEALRDAWNGKRATMDKLWRYAEICRVAKVLRPYLEAVGRHEGDESCSIRSRAFAEPRARGEGGLQADADAVFA